MTVPRENSVALTASADQETDPAPEPSIARPARPVGGGSGPRRWSTDAFKLTASRYALLGVWAVLIALFGTLMPQSFLRIGTLQAVLSSQSSLVFLAVAALITFLIGEFDLSFASVMGLSATIVPVLTTLHGVDIRLACVIALAVALACGMINAVFIVLVGVPSLIVTLGTASLFLGIAELISGSTIVAVSDPGFSNIALHRVFGLPMSFYYGLALCLAVGYFLAWTPTGRHVIFVGANHEVARLAGVRVQRVRALSYVAGSFVAGMAGILLVMTIGGFDPTASNTYLLPALAAVFLGGAIVRPGQFNPIGTWLGIYFLATGIFGLQLLGYTGWVQDAFYGAGLVLAVTIATLLRGRSRAT